MAELGVATTEIGVVPVSLMLLSLVLDVTSKLFSELLLSMPKRAWPGVLDGRGGWLSSSVRSIVSSSGPPVSSSVSVPESSSAALKIKSYFLYTLKT